MHLGMGLFSLYANRRRAQGGLGSSRVREESHSSSPLSRDPVMALPTAMGNRLHPKVCSPDPVLLRPGLPAMGCGLSRGWVGLARCPYPDANEDELAAHHPGHVHDEEDVVGSLRPASPRPLDASGGFCAGRVREWKCTSGSPNMSKRGNTRGCQLVSLPSLESQLRKI